MLVVDRFVADVVTTSCRHCWARNKSPSSPSTSKGIHESRFLCFEASIKGSHSFAVDACRFISQHFEKSDKPKKIPGSALLSDAGGKGFSAPLKVSDALQAVVGAKFMSRPAVVRVIRS